MGNLTLCTGLSVPPEYVVYYLPAIPLEEQIKAFLKGKTGLEIKIGLDGSSDADGEFLIHVYNEEEVISDEDDRTVADLLGEKGYSYNTQGGYAFGRELIAEMAGIEEDSLGSITYHDNPDSNLKHYVRVCVDPSGE
ncbi:hypothetical protein [Paenibacillus taichungensis]